jgi:long-chain fatty acid transport protein
MGPTASPRLPLSLFLAALLAPAAAHANGFALDIQGNFSNGTASAGAASAHDPAGQLANPAILAHLEGLQLVAGGQYIAPTSPYTDGGSSVVGGAFQTPGANVDGSKGGAIPWLFASYRVRPDLAVGFSFYAPFGTKTDFGGRSSSFYGRYQGVESTIESIAFGPAVAWKPVEWVSIGVSAAARRDHAIIGQSIDVGSGCVQLALASAPPGTLSPADAAAACAAAGQPAPGTYDGYARYTATGWAWTGTAGVTVDPVPGTRIGAAYRHEAQSKVKGDQSFDDRAAAYLVAAQMAGALNGNPSASLKLPLPDFATLSLEQRLGDSFQLLAALQYTLWSRFDVLTLTPDDPNNGLRIETKQGFRNAFRVSGAGVYTVKPGLDVFAGVAFEQSPITTKYRQVTLPERDSLIAGAGVEAKLYGGLSAGACYQRVQMLGTSKIDQVDPVTQTRVVGTVKGSANVGVVQLTWRG